MEKKSILIDGANGLIGSEMYKYFEEKYGNTYTLHRIDKSVNLDLCDYDAVCHWMLKWKPEYIIHLASLSDVQESNILPAMYFRNNLSNTLNLLEAVRLYNPTARVIIFNTDEVFKYEDGEYIKEDSPVNPRNPYAGSKLCQKAMALSYRNTYGLDIVVTHTTNNYGPYQSKVTHIGGGKKLIPALFEAAVNGTPFRMDDEGKARRTWISVWDTSSAVDAILFNGKQDCYNIAGDEVLSVKDIYDIVCEVTGKKIETYGTNRINQDFWYGLDCTRLKNELGWKPEHNVKETMKELWENKSW